MYYEVFKTLNDLTLNFKKEYFIVLQIKLTEKTIFMLIPKNNKVWKQKFKVT